MFARIVLYLILCPLCVGLSGESQEQEGPAGGGQGGEQEEEVEAGGQEGGPCQLLSCPGGGVGQQPQEQQGGQQQGDVTHLGGSKVKKHHEASEIVKKPQSWNLYYTALIVKII